MSAAPEAQGTMEVHVHPLVVMSIADHYTRVRVQSKDKSGKTRVMGVIFGTQDGRTVKVLETVEIAFTEEKSQVKIQFSALENDIKLFAACYPTYECLGWYCTSTQIEPDHSIIHKMITKYNERPLLILLNPLAGRDVRDLPITVYEETVHVVQDKTTTEFVSTQYLITSDEPERITMVHCAKVITKDEQGSTLTPHFSTLTRAISTLNTRLSVLQQYLRDVHSGKIPADQSILREIKGLCNRLPIMDSTQFKQDLLAEYNDALLVTYLSAITKGTSIAADVVEKHNITYSHASGKSSRSGGGERYGMGMGMGMGIGGMGGLGDFGMLGFNRPSFMGQ